MRVILANDVECSLPDTFVDSSSLLKSLQNDLGRSDEAVPLTYATVKIEKKHLSALIDLNDNIITVETIALAEMFELLPIVHFLDMELLTPKLLTHFVHLCTTPDNEKVLKDMTQSSSKGVETRIL